MFIKVIWKPDFQVDYSQEELKTKFCLRFLFLPVTCIQLQIIHLIFNYYIITPLFYGGKFENDPRTIHYASIRAWFRFNLQCNIKLLDPLSTNTRVHKFPHNQYSVLH